MCLDKAGGLIDMSKLFVSSCNFISMYWVPYASLAARYFAISWNTFMSRHISPMHSVTLHATPISVPTLALCTCGRGFRILHKSPVILSQQEYGIRRASAIMGNISARNIGLSKQVQ